MPNRQHSVTPQTSSVSTSALLPLPAAPRPSLLAQEGNLVSQPDESLTRLDTGHSHNSTFIRDGRVILDIGRYVPYFITVVHNKLARGSSAIYLERFGIGIVDWRVMASLVLEPGASASRICQLIELDKGAASRALTKLDELGYLEHEAAEHDTRRKTWTLNARGLALYDAVLDLALEREERLINGIDSEDLAVFIRVMKQMIGNLQDMG